jgi:hypothetical protein
MNVENIVEKTERRIDDTKNTALFNKLNLAQKFSANGLINFGYSIEHIRSTDEGLLAILKSNNDLATIDSEGEIDTKPSIRIRIN